MRAKEFSKFFSQSCKSEKTTIIDLLLRNTDLTLALWIKHNVDYAHNLYENAVATVSKNTIQNRRGAEVPHQYLYLWFKSCSKQVSKWKKKAQSIFIGWMNGCQFIMLCTVFIFLTASWRHESLWFNKQMGKQPSDRHTHAFFSQHVCLCPRQWQHHFLRQLEWVL